MNRTIITTVGTSLLTNVNWRRPQPLPEAEAVDRALAEADPIKASAETHTWFRLGLFEPDPPLRLRVVLVHSATDDGRFCAERLMAFARRRGVEVGSREVASLSDGTNFHHGLRNLAHVIGDEIRTGKAAGVVELAATGGFKAEIAVANLVGALSETPVHYIYAEFSSLVTIAPIPVSLRADWVRTGPGRAMLEALAAADGLIERVRIESLLRQDERLLTLVEFATVDGQEMAGLNLLGEFASRLIESPATNWPAPTDAEPRSKVRLDSAAHHRPKGWERIVDTVARSCYVTSIRYEGNMKAGNFREAPDNASDLLLTIDGSPPLTLRIGTTAQTTAERSLVQAVLRRSV